MISTLFETSQSAYISPCVSELRFDVTSVDIGEEKEGIGHPTAMTDSTPTFIAWLLKRTDLKKMRMLT
jgi:hypothetical protein